MFPFSSEWASRHCLAVCPNMATLSTSVSSAYLMLACVAVTSSGMRFMNQDASMFYVITEMVAYKQILKNNGKLPPSDDVRWNQELV